MLQWACVKRTLLGQTTQVGRDRIRMPVKALHVIIEVTADDQDDIQFLIRLSPIGSRGEKRSAAKKEKGRPSRNSGCSLWGLPISSAILVLSFLKKIAPFPR